MQVHYFTQLILFFDMLWYCTYSELTMSACLSSVCNSLLSYTHTHILMQNYSSFTSDPGLDTVSPGLVQDGTNCGDKMVKAYSHVFRGKCQLRFVCYFYLARALVCSTKLLVIEHERHIIRLQISLMMCLPPIILLIQYRVLYPSYVVALSIPTFRCAINRSAYTSLNSN